MKKKSMAINIAWMVLISVLAACNALDSSKSNFDPGYDVSVNDMNQSITLNQPPGDMKSLYDSTGTIVVYIENKSNAPVLFPPNYDVHVFIKDSAGWTSAPNDFSYSATDKTLPTKADYASGLVVFVRPILSQSETDLTLRIVVYGEIINTDKRVGGYIDIQLSSN